MCPVLVAFVIREAFKHSHLVTLDNLYVSQLSQSCDMCRALGKPAAHTRVGQHAAGSTVRCLAAVKIDRSATAQGEQRRTSSAHTWLVVSAGARELHMAWTVSLDLQRNPIATPRGKDDAGVECGITDATSTHHSLLSAREGAPHDRAAAVSARWLATLPPQKGGFRPKQNHGFNSAASERRTMALCAFVPDAAGALQYNSSGLHGGRTCAETACSGPYHTGGARAQVTSWHSSDCAVGASESKMASSGLCNKAYVVSASSNASVCVTLLRVDTGAWQVVARLVHHTRPVLTACSACVRVAQLVPEPSDVAVSGQRQQPAGGGAAAFNSAAAAAQGSCADSTKHRKKGSAAMTETCSRHLVFTGATDGSLAAWDLSPITVSQHSAQQTGHDGDSPVHEDSHGCAQAAGRRADAVHPNMPGAVPEKSVDLPHTEAVKPVWSTVQHHQSGINAMAVVPVDAGGVLVATGGDDQALRLVLLQVGMRAMQPSHMDTHLGVQVGAVCTQLSTIADTRVPRAHASAIRGLAACTVKQDGCTRVFVSSVGLDQVMRIWAIQGLQDRSNNRTKGTSSVEICAGAERSQAGCGSDGHNAEASLHSAAKIADADGKDELSSMNVRQVAQHALDVCEPMCVSGSLQHLQRNHAQPSEECAWVWHLVVCGRGSQTLRVLL